MQQIAAQGLKAAPTAPETALGTGLMQELHKPEKRQRVDPTAKTVRNSTNGFHQVQILRAEQDTRVVGLP